MKLKRFKHLTMYMKIPKNAIKLVNHPLAAVTFGILTYQNVYINQTHNP